MTTPIMEAALLIGENARLRQRVSELETALEAAMAEAEDRGRAHASCIVHHLAWGQFLALHRRQRGLLQTELAEKVGMTRSRIAQLEGGFINPQRRDLITLAGFFGLPVLSFAREYARRVGAVAD